MLLAKVTGVWLLLLAAAIVNAALREKLLTPWLGARRGLAASGVVLAALILLVTYGAIPLLAAEQPDTYIRIGLLWFALTLCFELGVGRFVARKPWRAILQVFNIRQGNLFILALLMTLIAPWLAAKLRGFI